MNRRTWRRTGLALVAVGAVILGSVGLGLSTAGAAAGNDGTVKIDGNTIGNGGPGNDPHVGCVFDVQWFGFDVGAQTATVSFDAQPPTGNMNLVFDNTIAFVGSGNPNTLDAHKTYDLSAAIQANNLVPQNQGYHISVTVDTTKANATQTKSKTFWVQGCFDPSLSAATCTGAGNTAGITLSITNNDQDAVFDIVQDGTPRGSLAVAAGATGTFNLPQTQGVQSVITVTSQANPNVSSQITVPAANCATPKGSVTLQKVLSGAGVQPPANTVFDFTITCADPGATIADATPNISPSQNAVVVASNVSLNTTCTINETNANAASSTSWQINNGASTAGTGPAVVTVTSSATPAAVKFTNQYNAALPQVYSVTLRKSVTGNAAPNPLPTYPFTVSCTDPGATFPLGASPSMTAGAAAVTVASNVSINTSCTITETDAHGATGTSFTVNAGVPSNGTSTTVSSATPNAVVAVAFTNRYDPAVSSITLRKQLAGSAAPTNDPAFEFSVTCADPNAIVTNPAVLHASNPAATIVVTNVTVGTSCTITETVTNGATGVSFTVNGVAASNTTSVTVTPSTTFAVAVVATNLYDPGSGPVIPPATTTTTTSTTTTTLPPTTTTLPPTTTTVAPTTTTVAPTTTTAAPAVVLGEEITRAPAAPTVLARTGKDTNRRILAGIALMFIGLTMLGFSKGIEYAVSGAAVRTAPASARDPQHAARMSMASRAKLSAAVAAAALLGRAKRK